jgi:hypothetical protein
LNETYQDHINRVARLSLPTSYNSQLQNIHKSPKFEKGKHTYFPGYSVTTPTMEDDPVNQEFYNNLKSWQTTLCQKLDNNFFVPIPPESFHLTVADLIWSSSFIQAVEENPNFERELRKSIEESLELYKQSLDGQNYSVWRSIGLIVKPRAIVISFIPKDEASYQQILNLRRCIYQNSNLIKLGIEQQYDLTAHITVGYFGELANDRNYCQQQQFDKTLAELSEQWLKNEPITLAIDRVELRKFDDMMRYYREDDWAVVNYRD